jgi:hypothetical protein
VIKHSINGKCGKREREREKLEYFRVRIKEKRKMGLA